MSKFLITLILIGSKRLCFLESKLIWLINVVRSKQEGEPELFMSFLYLALVSKILSSKSIIDSNLSDDERTYLSYLKNLTRLKIQKNFISNKGVAFLEGLDNLSELNLYGTRITDASFEVFSKMKGLKKVFLWKTQVTKKGVAQFAAQYPNIEVMVGY